MHRGRLRVRAGATVIAGDGPGRSFCHVRPGVAIRLGRPGPDCEPNHSRGGLGNAVAIGRTHARRHQAARRRG